MRPPVEPESLDLGVNPTIRDCHRDWTTGLWNLVLLLLSIH